MNYLYEYFRLFIRKIETFNYNYLNYKYKMNSTICPICYENIDNKNVTTTSCGHQFHTDCLLKSFNNRSNKVCPYCRNKLINDNAPKNFNDVIGITVNDLFEYMGEIDDIYTESDLLHTVKNLNIQNNQLSPELARIVKSAEENIQLLNQIKNGNEQKKELLKRYNPDKYKLFYGNK